jgi:hypothetical protein
MNGTKGERGYDIQAKTYDEGVVHAGKHRCWFDYGVDYYDCVYAGNGDNYFVREG